MRLDLETMLGNLFQGVSDAVRLEANRLAFRQPEPPNGYTVGQRVFLIDHYNLGTVVKRLPSGMYRVDTTTLDGRQHWAYDARLLRNADLATSLTMN